MADIDDKDPEAEIRQAEFSVQEIIDKVGQITATIQAAERKLVEVAGTVEDAEGMLSGIKEVVVEVTGLEEVDVPAAVTPAQLVPAATPVADAIAASSSSSSVSGTNSDIDVVYECLYEERVVTNKFAVDDYNFETSTTDLITSVDGKGKTKLRMYEYPGLITKTAEGETKANLRIQEQEAFGKTLKGAGYCRSFSSGYTFELTEHENKAWNAKYLIHDLEIECTQTDYHNRFVAVPVSSTLKPRRKTRKPVIAGTQTAIVVGKDGEEIWTDKYGRVKVKFHWDQAEPSDETTSCWVRVAQTWTGAGWGAIFIPRIGMEVVVSFLEGDPDRPLITGMVYNAQQVVPYNLPDEQTKSTIKTNSTKEGEGGFNELRFEDKKGNEEVYIHAQKDMNLRVENDLVEIVKNDKVELITNQRQVFVKKPDQASEDSVALAAKPDLDAEGIEVLIVEGGNRKIHVKGDDKAENHENDGTFKHVVGKTFTLTVKGDTITIEATGANGSGDIVIKGKTISIESTAGEVKIKSATAMSLQSGTDMKLKAGKEFKAEAGANMALKAGLNFKAEAVLNLELKAGVGLKAEAGVTFAAKGGLSLKAEGGAMLEVKGGAMGVVESGGLLKVKGAMVMIN